jgi:hypothetical protein
MIQLRCLLGGSGQRSQIEIEQREAATGTQQTGRCANGDGGVGVAAPATGTEKLEQKHQAAMVGRPSELTEDGHTRRGSDDGGETKHG